MSANLATELPKVIPSAVERQIAELIASYEIAMDRLAAREKALEAQFHSSENFLNEQLEKINTLMAELREIMTEAGAARWRLSAQEALKLGDTQLQSLHKLSEETRTMVRESCARFERTSSSTVKNVNEAVNSFNVEEFKNFVEYSYEKVKSASSVAVEKITDILRWFQWKNLLIALGLALVVAVAIGLYIDDEWPWEIHQKVVDQRKAGVALMNAWPHLNKNDQQFLQQKILDLSKT
jgi:hypothetical protein